MADTLAPRKPRRSERNDTSQTASDIANSHYPADDQAVYCISDEELPRTDQIYQKETFEMMVTAGVDPMWLPAEKCLEEDPGDSFFVLPSFQGPVFEYLRNSKAKVLSTALVRQCLTEAKPLPKWNHPVASLNMTNAKVCFTGMSLEMRQKLSNLVWWMNGEVMRDLQPSVTHLITEKCVAESDKYRACRNRKVPVMLPSWVEDAWKAAEQREYRDFLDEGVIATYRTPLFNHKIICTTGVVGQERMDLMRVIEQNGGKCPGEMRKGACTHLVTEGTVGNKYRKAREWKIHVVTIRWIRKSVELNYLQDEKRFDPENTIAAKSSTQTPDAVAPVDLDMSSIYGVLKNHTVNSQFGGNLNASRVGNQQEKPATPVTMPRVLSKRRVSPREEAANSEALDKLLNITIKGDYDFFEGWGFYICGLEKPNLDKINRILDRCGATRVASIDQATHIIVVNAGSDRNTLSKMQREQTAVLVKMDWLAECVEKKDMVDTEGYAWEPEGALSRSISVVNVTERTLFQVPGSAKSRRSNGANSTASTIVSNPLNIVTETEAVNADELATVPVSSLFSKCTFRLDLLESDAYQHLEEKVLRAGGTILTDTDEQIADYMVGNPIELAAAPSPKHHKFLNLVTENFVEFCLDRRRLAGPKERPLFRPVPGVSGSKVFEEVVIGFMGLLKVDKDYLIALVERFGGKVEGSIVSAPRDGIKPCTHLVVGEQNAKLEECKKKLPKLKVVDPSWIIECIINDSIVLEFRFPFSGSTFANYQRTDDLWDDPPPTFSTVNGTTNGNYEGNNTVHMEEADAHMPMEEEPQENMDITLNEPVDFGKCTTSTPIGGGRRSAVRPRKSISDPMRFNPRLVLDGMTQFIDQMPSPAGTEADVSTSFNASEIRGMLAAAAIRTGNPTPQRSVTEPTPGSRQRTSQRTSRSSATPRRAPAAKEETKPLAAPVYQQQEAVTLMMNEQLQRMEAMRRREEEEEVEEKVVNVAQEAVARTARKRALHELLDDSPAAPMSKRNMPPQGQAIGWKIRESEEANEPAERRQSTGSNSKRAVQQPVTVEERTERASSHGGTSVREMQPDYTDDVISIPPSPLRRSSRLSGSPSVQMADSTSNQGSRRSIRRSASIVPSPREPTPEPEKVFLFSGLSHEDKESLPEMATRLGSRVIASEKQEVCDEVTHLVTGKMVRGTKLMGCIASGRWVLTPDYIKESAAAGRWLPEEDYEWASPTIVQKKGVKGRELEIANAARRWRREERRGAFEGWRVLLYASVEKATGVAPLLEAGRAKVFARETSTVETARPTHVIVVKSKDWTSQELEKVVAAGAKVFTLDYISHILLDESVREEEWYHPDYKVIRRRM